MLVKGCTYIIVDMPEDLWLDGVTGAARQVAYCWQGRAQAELCCRPGGLSGSSL